MVAYRLALPLNMFQVHLVFHVLMLREYISDPSHVLQPYSVELNEDLTFEEETSCDFRLSSTSIEIECHSNG